MELLTEKIFALVFLLVGVSHLLQPATWSNFFSWLRAKPFGAFIVMMYTLPLSIVLLIFHNSWEIRPALFLTIAGWVMLVKCVVYALYPASFNRVATKGASAKNLVIAGILIILLSGATLADIYLF